MFFVVTPIKPNPTTPRAKERVEKIRTLLPGLFAAATGAGDQAKQVSPSRRVEISAGRCRVA
jgi:hypothetical protein